MKLVFHGSTTGKESTCSAGDPGLFPGSEISAEEGISYPLLYSWASLVVQMVKNLVSIWDLGLISELRRYPSRSEWLSTPAFWLGEFHGQIFHELFCWWICGCNNLPLDLTTQQVRDYVHFCLFFGISQFFCFLLSKLPLVIFENWNFSSSTTSLRVMSPCPHYYFFFFFLNFILFLNFT